MRTSGAGRSSRPSARWLRRAAAVAIGVSTIARHRAGRRAASRDRRGVVAGHARRGGLRVAPPRRVRGGAHAALDLSRVPRGKRVIVSVALVRLDTLAEPRTTDATCEISATLRDARGGTDLRHPRKERPARRAAVLPARSKVRPFTALCTGRSRASPKCSATDILLRCEPNLSSRIPGGASWPRACSISSAR